MTKLLGLCAFLGAAVAVSMCMGAPAASAQTEGIPCVMSRIASIKMPVGPARYQAGKLQLENDMTLELSGSPQSPELRMVAEMKPGDRVAVCHGPEKTYADAGRVHTITLLDMRTSGYVGTLIGTMRG